MAIVIKSSREMDIMREAGRINARVLEAVSEAARPGVTTAELDALAEDLICSAGATPAFLGYPNRGDPEHPYPATLNTSVDGELVHGVPSQRRLREGQILSIDCGTVWKGYVGDSAVTVPVGRIPDEAQRLLDVTREALRLAIEAARAGSRVGDVSHAVQSWVESQGMQVVREYTGHGVGRQMHEDPQIPNWGVAGHGQRLRAGMTVALEPMVTLGPPDLYVKADRWTVATRDGGLSAHFEHTIAITDGQPVVLTVP